MSTSKLIWILAGNRRGDNNQMLALAEAIGLPFEIKILAYNPLHHLPPLRRGLLHVERRARASIKPPWPDLVIAIGANSPPVARYIRRRSGGRTRLVQIGDDVPDPEQVLDRGVLAIVDLEESAFVVIGAECKR